MKFFKRHKTGILLTIGFLLLILWSLPETFASTTATFYPSLDGYVYRDGAEVNWATIRASAGTQPDNSFAWSFFQSGSTSNNWGLLGRGFIFFDTSSLPDDATITSATFSIQGDAKADPNSASPAIVLTSSNSNSTSSLIASDFQSLGSSRLSDTDIAYADISLTGFNDFILNSGGISAISLTDITRFCITTDKDLDNTAPDWVSGERTTITFKNSAPAPKLVITYTIPSEDFTNGEIIISFFLFVILIFIIVDFVAMNLWGIKIND